MESTNILSRSETESPLSTSDDESERRTNNDSAQANAQRTGDSGVAEGEFVDKDVEDDIMSEIQIDGSLSIMSEATKPDPPSVLDYSHTEENEEDKKHEWIGAEFMSQGHSSIVELHVREEVLEVEPSRNEKQQLLSNSDSRLEPDESDAAEVLLKLSDDDGQPSPDRYFQSDLSINSVTGEVRRSRTFAPASDGSRSTPQAAVLQDTKERPRVYDAPTSDSLTVSPYLYRGAGQDEIILLPRVDEHRPPTLPVQSSFLQPQLHHAGSFHFQPMGTSVFMPTTTSTGRRKIRLRLQEDVRSKARRGILGHIRQRSSRIVFGSADFESMNELGEYKAVDRGTVNVSWYEGTSSLELQQHVQKSVIRKLQLDNQVVLSDFRILDESSDPPEEIVLSPFIPDGSQFLLRFSTKDATNDGTVTPASQYSTRPPESPSAAPSPHPMKDILVGLNANQLALLSNLNIPSTKKERRMSRTMKLRSNANVELQSDRVVEEREKSSENLSPEIKQEEANQEPAGLHGEAVHDGEEEDMALVEEDPIEARLRQITELLIADRQKRPRSHNRRQEKRQVIFVLANYFVLFLSLIAISAEIHARAPGWLSEMEKQMKNVQDCAANQDALFQCVSNGDFAGLIASIILWLSRSVATKRIFLFGFETPNKLWTVVYESLVTAVCWGFSYVFIRRGLNPDTRPRFIQKYWKDAVYGSLAGFNAAFMKHVLKNLIPQEVVEDALRERQLKILSWLPSFA